MPLSPADWTAWKAAAIAITPGFETEGDPYEGVSGDFDGMGISCGALQWNIGMGSLQPMVKKAGKTNVLATMPAYGQALWDACNGSIKNGLAIVRGWQTGTKLKAAPKAELRALMGGAIMRTVQDEKIEAVAQRALKAATTWAAARNEEPSKRLFCWFFDLITQNGGLEGLTYKQVADFIKLNTPYKSDDVVCDFLATYKGAGHGEDARKNAAAWRNKADAEKLELLTMSYLRSGTASAKWRHVVLNRKGAIAMGGGWVNSTQYNFKKYGL